MGQYVSVSEGGIPVVGGKTVAGELEQLARIALSMHRSATD